MRTCPACQKSYPDDTEFCSRDGSALPPAITATIASLESGLARRFKVLRRLGEGGMGVVFLAEQIAVGHRPVALKVLLRKLLDDPEFLLRFQDEASSTGRIRHPNVVTIHESGQSDDGSPYIAMEYLEGETLRHAIKTRGALSIADCARILQQVSRGLNAAHKLGILHRDLKPDNIFLAQTDDGEVIAKVMDFGLAKLRQSSTHTITGTILGTPAYMSPEQALGMKSEDLDARSDLYALAITAYEMLTGRVPFHSDTPIGYLHKQITETPPPFRALAPGLEWPSALEAVVMKALAKEREQRHASALDFAREFCEAANVTMAGSPSPGMVRASNISSGDSRSDAATTWPVGDSGAPAVRPRAAVETPTTPLRVTPVTPPPQPSARSAPPPLAVPAPPPVPTPPPARRSEIEEPTYAKGAYAAPPVYPTKAAKSYKWIYFVGGPLFLMVAGVGLYFMQSRGGSVQTAFVPATSSPANSAAATPARASENPGAASGAAHGPAPEGMIAVPSGVFAMGRNSASDAEETPAHLVQVQPFFMDKVPVANIQYLEFARKEAAHMPPSWQNGSFPPSQGDWWPVTGVSWADAQDYCGSRGARLPTEAEWEYAARGTDERLYPWGNDFNKDLTNSKASGRREVEPVGSHSGGASPFGVLDMSGNIWEWMADDYKPYPGRAPAFDIPADAKVIRGGSFQSDKDHVTATTRNLDHAGTRSPVIGFRCAKSQ